MNINKNFFLIISLFVISFSTTKFLKPVPAAVRSKAQALSYLTAGIAGSRPVKFMAVRLLCLCCVGSGFCHELINHSEEQSARMFVCVCVQMCGFINLKETLQVRAGLLRCSKKFYTKKYGTHPIKYLRNIWK